MIHAAIVISPNKSVIYQNLMYPRIKDISFSEISRVFLLSIFCTNGEKNSAAASESCVLVLLSVFLISSI